MQLVKCFISSNISLDEFKLWDVGAGTEISSFPFGRSPVFPLDCSCLVYLEITQSDRYLIVFSLRTMDRINRVACNANLIQVVPAHREFVLATTFPSDPSSKTIVTLLNFKNVASEKRPLSRNLTSVATKGFLDISKDGAIAVDGLLQIFSIFNGGVNLRFVTPERREFTTVRLTDDGRFVIWVDEMSVNVGRVADGAVVAHTSTHEAATCLHTIDHGYVLLVGRIDGNLLTMKLIVDALDGGQLTYRPQGVSDRR